MYHFKRHGFKVAVDLEAMKDVSGVGNAKLKKYGSRFVEATGFSCRSA
jgi:superfamily II DNA helicase RecQ